MGEIIETASIL